MYGFELMDEKSSITTEGVVV